MAGRRVDVLDLREMLRRLRLGESARTIAKDLGSSRNTVRDYAKWFEGEGLLTDRLCAGPLRLITSRKRLGRSERWT